MRDTTATGNVTNAFVAAALLRTGRRVLWPMCEGGDYDLAVDDDGKLLRVQCKTGRLARGAVVFRAYTVLRGGGRRSYRGRADVFGVYCAANGQVYLVPVDDVPLNEVSLRVEPAKSNRVVGTRPAEQYQI